MASGRLPPIPPNRLPPVFEETHHRQLLDDFTLRAMRHQAKQVPGTPPVFPLPLRNHPMWSGNNELGIQADFAPDANNEQTIVKLDEWGMPQIWTIALGLDDPDSILTAFGFEVVALIKFGSGGVTQEIEVDWLEGATISLPMNAVNVIAKYGFPDGGGEFEVGLPVGLRLRVSIVRGDLSRSNPTRSYRLAEDQSNLRIPPFAQAVLINTGLALPGITPFSFYSQTQAGRGYVTFTANIPSISGAVAAYEYSQLVSYLDFINEVVGSPQPLPIPPRARYIEFVDAAGAPFSDNRVSVVQFLLGA